MEDISQHPVIKQILQDTIDLAVSTFKRAVERENLIASEELLNSIQAGAVISSSDFITGSVEYSKLLRIKDIKNLRYSTIPPLKEIFNWVHDKGVHNFPYISGYEDGKRPKELKTEILRISNGIRFKLKSVPNVRRGYRSIHNDSINNNILPAFYLAMQDFAMQYAQSQVIESFGITPINIYNSFDNSTEGRMNAGENAKQTKIARKLGREIGSIRVNVFDEMYPHYYDKK